MAPALDERDVLEVAEAQEVADALLDGLDEAVEHGAVGHEAETVGGPVDVAPDVGFGFAAANLVEVIVVEDFGAAAG